MRIAVCDDHPLCLRELERQLREIPLVREIRCFSVPEALFQAVRAGEVYDAVLLDIDFRTSDTGIDAAEALYALSPGTRIIYMTGYTDRFVQQIFLRNSNLCGYLTKPVDPALLAANLQKLVRSAAEDGGLTLRVNGALVAVPYREIVYLESRNHAVLVHTREEVITTYQKLEEVMAQLPKTFVQCHKSFGVNLYEIRQFRAAGILLREGTQIPVSRSRNAAARAAFFALIGQSV